MKEVESVLMANIREHYRYLSICKALACVPQDGDGEYFAESHIPQVQN